MAGHVPISSDPSLAIEADEALGVEAISLRYGKALQRFFAQRVSNPSDIGDLVQQVFVRVLQRSDGQPIEHVQGYLFQVAASVLNDEYRKARVRHADDHEAFDEHLHAPRSEISPERILLGEEALARLTAAVRQLPTLTRAVYILRVQQEREYADIARQLRMSERSAQRHMARALEFLEAVLGDDRPLDPLPRGRRR